MIAFPDLTLLSDARVFDCTKAGNRHLEQSNGTEIAASARYEREARIPRKPWRPLPTTSPVLAKEDLFCFSPGRDVAIIDVPPALMKAIEEIEGFDDLGNIEGKLLDFAYPLVSDASVQVRILGAHSRPVGLATTTFNPATSAYIGMHLDSFYKFPLSQRHLAPNRLCINIGAGTRFFLFINVPLRKMQQLLLECFHESALPQLDIGNIGTIFMQAFPDYPVLKVPVGSAEAYLAPTENLYHDSTTEDCSASDVALTLLGSFTPR